jgi:DeoR/GlpR family transcriptional regulator of sugar metabolism
LIPEQRQKELLRFLRTAGVLSIRDITELLSVSHMTVRRDIANLEASGHVVGVQGGVRLAESSGPQPPPERSSRAQLSLPHKRAVGELAAALVEDGMVVFLGAGIMCELVVPFLAARKGVTVVTNSYYVAAALFDCPQIETIHTGGTIDVDSRSSGGPFAAATLSSVNLDLCFLSTQAWDVEHGVTTMSAETVLLERAALDAASLGVLLAGSGNFGSLERFNIVPLAKLHAIVTDSALPEPTRHAIQDLGVGICIAGI